ncbi:MAG: DNA recombination protein RmuC [Cellvibrionaceae bacterium]|nr:DNA recombination protein RmuC [Cellvibrionaceae bacterium]
MNIGLSEIIEIPIIVAILLVASIVFFGAVFCFLFYLQQSKRMRQAEQDTAALVAEHNAIIQSLNHKKDLEIARLKTIVDVLQEKRQEALDDLSAAKKKVELLLQRCARSVEKEASLEKEKALIQRAKEQLLKDFEISANKLYEKNQRHFFHTSKTSIESVVSPFKSQLQAFNRRVEDMVQKESNQRVLLAGQIVELQKQAHHLSSEANSLATALKNDNKLQGSWGEIILERVLEQSGLVQGREYHTQKTYVSNNGKKQRPDVIIHLPEGKDIIIDSKVSLVAYERYSSAVDRGEQEKFLSDHVDSVRAHVKSLSLKKYESLPDVRTLDFVLLFIPIETAYLAALQGNSELFMDAYRRSIVIVSPSSLMVALKTIETLWRQQKQNVNAEKIAVSAGALYDQFVLLVEAFDEIESALRKADDVYGKARKRLVDGRGNVLHKVEQLRMLGAKTTRQLATRHQSEDPGDDQSPSIDYTIEK